jgi:hypothetical protein
VIQISRNEKSDRNHRQSQEYGPENDVFPGCLIQYIGLRDFSVSQDGQAYDANGIHHQ